MQEKENEILIIGAGLAGLTAAYHLEKKSIPFKIIEARNRVGGRILTEVNEFGGTIEMGATWFAQKHRNLFSLIEELRIPIIEQYSGTHAIYEYGAPQRMVQKIQLPIQEEVSYRFGSGSHSLIQALVNNISPKRISFGEEVKSLDFQGDNVLVPTDK